ncbi:MAG TPA: hypothetical protein PKA06_14515 [Gemmatales bacterium]|nr:hypothetical protein [Gemmatales bacterium]HMP18327.1 hypothetical protein [Gemmatales bacterium]
MIRRFDDTPWITPAPVLPTPPEPAFQACQIHSVPQSIQQLWQAIYQTALTHAVMKALLENQPSRYQKLVYRVCLN